MSVTVTRALRHLAATAALALAVATPATAHVPPSGNGAGKNADFSQPRKGVEEVGFHPLHNSGFNTDVWGQTTSDGRLFAYSGTWGTLEGFADPGEACPSQSDDPTNPRQSGVKVVDATDPANPELAARIGSVPGAQNNDVKVARVASPSFEGDLLAHSLEPCGAEGLLFQVFGPPVTDVPVNQTGFELYDVSEPTQPRKLGTYNNGGLGTHNLFIVPRPDLGKSFVAAVYNDVGLLSDVYGELQIVDVTDPRRPQKAATWNLEAGQLPCEARGTDSQMCYLHDVWASADGKTLYLSYWDAGLVLLDISDPSNPRMIGRGQEQLEGDGTGWLDEEGNTHAAVPYEHDADGRKLVIVGDEDFTGGGTVQVQVAAPADVAGNFQAIQWDGTAAVTGQTAELVYAGTGCTSASYAAAGVAGKIALVDSRQSATNPADRCPTYLFKQKVEAAERAGAIGLVQVDNDDVRRAGTAIVAGIPALEILNKDGAPVRDKVIAGESVSATLDRGLPVDPWGFSRTVDVTSANDDDWRQTSVNKAPHVEDEEPGADDVYSAHNPIVGSDGRVYYAWYTNGLRVLEYDGRGGFSEERWFVPRPSDHENDLDEDPHGAQEANVGFWGSYPVCHPATGERLVLNSDLNRGLYVLRLTKERCGKKGARR